MRVDKREFCTRVDEKKQARVCMRVDESGEQEVVNVS